jgi:hypothetical protein
VNTLRYVLLESPIWLILCALVAELIVLWLHQRRGWSARWPPFVVPALAVLLLIVQWLVVTDQEALRALTQRLAAAVAKPDVDAFVAEIDDGFRLGDVTRENIHERLYRFLERTTIEQAGVGAFDITVTGDQASVSFRARARIETGDAGLQEYVGRWRLDCIRRPDGWRVRGVEHLGSPGIGHIPVEQLLGG